MMPTKSGGIAPIELTVVSYPTDVNDVVFVDVTGMSFAKLIDSP